MKRSIVLLLSTTAVLFLFQSRVFGQGGIPLWTNRYNGPGSTGIAVDSSGNAIVTGYNGSAYATIKYSSAGIPLWTNLYNGGFGYNYPTAIAVDDSGNVFVTGYSRDDTNTVYATIAYSSMGMTLWTNRYNGYSGFGAGYNEPHAIAVGCNGNVFVTGFSSSTVGLTYDSDYATIAYTGAGVPLWTNRYNGPGNNEDGARAIALDSSGNVLVTGCSIGAGGYPFSDYATIKYSSTGVPLWTNRYTGGSIECAGGAVVDANGSVFVTGYSHGGSSLYDYAAVAYSSTGMPLWTNRYNGPANGDDTAVAIVADGSGIVYVTGSSSGGSNSDDYATIAYSSGGVALWTNRYNGPGNGTDKAKVIAVDGSGNAFVTGYSLITNTYPGNFYDYTTIAYSSAGVPLWTNRYNGPGNGDDYATAIALDASGNVFVTGNSGGYATIKYSAVTMPSILLEIQRMNNQVGLSWTNVGFSLQSAPAITGPFTNISGAKSPYTNPISGTQQYFRLISN